MYNSDDVICCIKCYGLSRWTSYIIVRVFNLENNAVIFRDFRQNNMYDFGISVLICLVIMQLFPTCYISCVHLI